MTDHTAPMTTALAESLTEDELDERYADDPRLTMLVGWRAIAPESQADPARLLARMDAARATIPSDGRGRERRSLVLADREAELLEVKGPCSDPECRLHFAHRGPHDVRDPAASGDTIRTGVEALLDLRRALSRARDVGALTPAEWQCYASVPVGQGDGASAEYLARLAAPAETAVPTGSLLDAIGNAVYEAGVGRAGPDPTWHGVARAAERAARAWFGREAARGPARALHELVDAGAAHRAVVATFNEHGVAAQDQAPAWWATRAVLDLDTAHRCVPVEAVPGVERDPKLAEAASELEVVADQLGGMGRTRAWVRWRRHALALRAHRCVTPTRATTDRDEQVTVEVTLTDPGVPDWGGEQTDAGTPLYHQPWDTVDGEYRLWVGPYEGQLDRGWSISLSGAGLDVDLTTTPDRILRWVDGVRQAITSSRAEAKEAQG